MVNKIDEIKQQFLDISTLLDPQVNGVEGGLTKLQIIAKNVQQIIGKKEEQEQQEDQEELELSEEQEEQEEEEQEGEGKNMKLKPPKTFLYMVGKGFKDSFVMILCLLVVINLVFGIANGVIIKTWDSIKNLVQIIFALVLIKSVSKYTTYRQSRNLKELNKLAENNRHQISQQNFNQQKIQQTQQLKQQKIQQTKQFKQALQQKIQQTKTINKQVKAAPKIVLQQQQQDTFKMELQSRVSQLLNNFESWVKIPISILAGLVIIKHFYFRLIAEGFIWNILQLQTISKLLQFFSIISTITFGVFLSSQNLFLIGPAYTISNLKNENNLVRYLNSCDKLGMVNEICCGKTEFLTNSVMKVSKIFIEQKISDMINLQTIKISTFKILSQSICSNISNEEGQMDIQPNKTQCALIQMINQVGLKESSWEVKPIKTFAFSSQKMKAATICISSQRKVYAFVKGAADILSPNCKKFINQNGSVSEINPNFTDSLQNNIQEFSSSGLKVILIAYKQITKPPQNQSQVYRDLTFIALIGISNPLKGTTQDAVKKCSSAGIKVRMTTGDHMNTAIAVAKEAGLLHLDWKSEGIDDYTVMNGSFFRKFVGGLQTVIVPSENVQGQYKKIKKIRNIQNFKKVADKLVILSRCSARDRQMMVVGLKQLGKTVAVAGHREIDAAIMKKCDVSFSMGVNGTQTAKTSSSIILLDDSLFSIIAGVKWSRNFLTNIHKLLQFQLTVSLVILAIGILGFFIHHQPLITPIQILWIHILNDFFAGLSLITEPPNQQLLEISPEKNNQALVTPNMWKNIITQVAFQTIILGIILIKCAEILQIPSSLNIKDRSEDTAKHYSIFFNIFVFLQIFNQINCRKFHQRQINVFEGMKNNKLFLFVLFLQFLIQIILNKYAGYWINTVKLSFSEIIFCLLTSSIILLTNTFTKILLPHHIVICRYGFQFGQYKIYWAQLPTQHIQKNE